MKTEQLFKVKGQMAGGVAGNLIALTVGIGVTILVLILVSVLGAKVYSTVEDDIAAINDSAIKASVTGGIQSSFEAIEETGGLMPIVVLAVMIFLVLSLVVGFTALGGGGQRGSVL